MKEVKYKISKKEIVVNFSYVILTIFLLGKIFYGKWMYGIGLIPMGAYLFSLRKRDIQVKAKRELGSQFKELLVTISDLASTGHSVENAIRESYRDMLQMYGEKACICREIKIMVSQLNVNIPVEKVIADFANRTELEEAFTFSQIFCVAKKRGGSMVEIIKNVTDTIILKETVKEDIKVAIAEKKMEQKIMTIIPLALVGYISFASPGFLDVMYETWMGRIVMSICLICYMSAYVWSRKICEIEV